MAGWVRQAGVALAVVTGCVLLGAPLGLLWAAVSPRVEVLVAGEAVQVPDPTTADFIAADGVFLLLAVLAGVVTGVVVARLAPRSGLAAVAGLALGGLLAAEVARATGELVDLDSAQAAVDAGRQGLVELGVRLRARSAQLGWPVAALVALMVVTVLRPDDDPAAA